MFLYLKPVVNDYILNRINYITDELNRAKPGKRIWIDSNKYHNSKDYTLTERSTYPFYIKFAYDKKPKKWYLLSEEEKLKERIYYCYNKRNIFNVFKKILNGKTLTYIQQNFVMELMTNFLVFEKEFEYIHKDTFDNVLNYYNKNSINNINNINNINDDIDMSLCPF